MDKKLLLDIFKIPSSSRNEEAMREYIIRFLQNEAIPYSIDDYGNVFNVNCKNRPLLNAHMDTVQDEIDGKLQKFVKIYNEQFLKGYGTIGADDKCGIYIILELLKTNEFNFLFTVEEEAGCIGSAKFMLENDISYIPYGLTFDRYGASDILCVDNDYGVKEFENELIKIGINYGYKSAKGLISDADNISDQISTCNLSVGYYNHHTKNEFVDIEELDNAVHYAQAILDNIIKKFPAPIKTTPNYYGGYDYGYYDGGNIFSDEEEVCFVTGKKDMNLIYLSTIKKYISPEGAKLLFEELEETGILYEIYSENYKIYNNNYGFEELEDGFQRSMMAD